jgi:hypothetical protein
MDSYCFGQERLTVQLWSLDQWAAVDIKTRSKSYIFQRGGAKTFVYENYITSEVWR